MVFRPLGIEAHLGMELLATPCGHQLYLNSYSRYFLSSGGSTKNTRVSVTFADSSTVTFTATRLQGGQRLLLPEEQAEILLNTLANGESFHIAAGWLASEITPTNFCDAYAKIENHS